MPFHLQKRKRHACMHACVYNEQNITVQRLIQLDNKMHYNLWWRYHIDIHYIRLKIVHFKH